jgi:hypothetical protein
MSPFQSQLEAMLNPANPDLKQATAAHLAFCRWQGAIERDKKLVQRMKRDFLMLWFQLEGVF